MINYEQEIQTLTNIVSIKPTLVYVPIIHVVDNINLEHRINDMLLSYITLDDEIKFKLDKIGYGYLRGQYVNTNNNRIFKSYVLATKAFISAYNNYPSTIYFKNEISRRRDAVMILSDFNNTIHSNYTDNNISENRIKILTSNLPYWIFTSRDRRELSVDLLDKYIFKYGKLPDFNIRNIYNLEQKILMNFYMVITRKLIFLGRPLTHSQHKKLCQHKVWRIKIRANPLFTSIITRKSDRKLYQSHQTHRKISNKITSKYSWITNQ